MAAFESITGVVLMDPWMLMLTAFIPLALWRRRGRGEAAVWFAPAAFAVGGSPAGSRSWAVRLLVLPRVLRVVSLLLVVIALARPVGRDHLPLTTEGIDIMLCLDLSSSMRAKDMDPQRSRLEIARAAAAEFVEERPHDRVGLVCFARYPDLRCPPTLDHRALRQFIAGVRMVERDGPEDATGIGTAIARAAQVLQAGEARSKVVILLTDGEENVASAETPGEIAPVHAAQLCRELDVRVYTIVAGIGREKEDGSFAPLDTRQVERVARKTGGRFFTARDAAAVSEVYAAVDRLEKDTFDEPRYRMEDRFLPFLLLGLIMFLCAEVLGASRMSALP